MRWGNYEDDIAWGTTLLKNAVALTPAQCEWDAADVLVYEPMAWGYGKSPSQFAPVEAALTAAGVRYDVLPALDFSISRRPLSEYSAVVIAMNGGRNYHRRTPRRRRHGGDARGEHRLERLCEVEEERVRDATRLRRLASVC